MSRIEGGEALAAAQLEIAALARRHLLIRATSLDSLPRTPAFLDALVAIAKRHPQSRIRILYSTLAGALETGHPLIGLARRLSSSLFLRQCDERDAAGRDQWWLADRFALLTLPEETRAAGVLDTNAKAQGPRHQEAFEECWERGREDVSLRDIFI